jgi:hypothetical protein
MTGGEHQAVERAWLCIVLAACVSASSPLAAQSSSRGGAPGVDALGAIVGTWQSDVVDGRSALANCVWTPQHGAVLCEQTITTGMDVHHALNVFTFDATRSKYFLYVVPQPGSPATLVPIVIDGTRWIYGGDVPASGGRRVRTINDFSDRDSYTWWTESSDDGEHWTRMTGGRNTRTEPRR